jgi:hypothetical protein
MDSQINENFALLSPSPQEDGFPAINDLPSLPKQNALNQGIL